MVRSTLLSSPPPRLPRSRERMGGGGRILDNKKGPRRALDFRAPPHLAGGLSTPGGALSYEDRNKITQGCALRFQMHLICIAAAWVKPIAAGIRHRGPRRSSNARLKSE